MNQTVSKGVFVVILLLMFLYSCNKAMSNQESSKLKQGISGQLIWLEGNVMPSVETAGQPNPQGQPVQREVYVYELTKTSEAERKDQFYSNIQTTLVKKLMSEPDGSFKVPLPPGKYSVFVKEPRGLFANLFDGYGNIMPVEVYEDEFTEVTIEINYMAAY